MFALFVVPIIVVLGGTMAFSAWSGTTYASFNETAAVVGFTEHLNFVGTNANLTPIDIGNGSANITVTHNSPQFLVDSSSGSAGGMAIVYANVSNMLPGDWVQFSVQISNTGSASLYAGEPQYNEINGSYTMLPDATSVHRGSILNSEHQESYAHGNAITLSTPLSQAGVLAPGNSIEYNVYITLPTDIPPSFAGTSHSVIISVPLTAVQ